ncbi:MAG: 16S rRNA (cytidine(1402)-2'-O)-methyltransferase [Deltaproteobacteria bacterium]|nr:16S rRNA (cytidine(1402)-2'-O)-methyltransferase [Deltaproteobacteria bacterium]
MADRKHHPQSGALYIVATPIGNREDITLRALRILKEVDLIAAEDTRRTRRLLAHYKIKNRLTSYHEHNETQRSQKLVQKLKQGASLALVSNAGTPAISDPGYALIEAAISNDIKIIPVPGASAFTAALSASGLPTDSFVFTGFLAKKQTKRLKQLQELAADKRTLIFYESPKRIRTLLNEMIQVMGDRYAVLSREMTKRHEEFLRGPLSEIEAQLSTRPEVKGEFTLMVAAANDIPESIDSLKEELERELTAETSPLSDIVRGMAKKYGISRTRLYKMALEIKSKRR